MNFSNIIVLAVVAGIVALAVWYIRREKKNGVQCIGCPDSKTCSGHCAGCSGNCAGRRAAGGNTLRNPFDVQS